MLVINLKYYSLIGNLYLIKMKNIWFIEKNNNKIKFSKAFDISNIFFKMTEIRYPFMTNCFKINLYR